MTFSFFSSELLSTKWESILVSHFAGSQSIIHGWHSGHSCWWWEFMQNWFIHMIFFFFFFLKGPTGVPHFGNLSYRILCRTCTAGSWNKSQAFQKVNEQNDEAPLCELHCGFNSQKYIFSILWKQCKYRATSWIELTFTVDYSSLTWSLVGLPEKPVYMGK